MIVRLSPAVNSSEAPKGAFFPKPATQVVYTIASGTVTTTVQTWLSASHLRPA